MEKTVGIIAKNIRTANNFLNDFVGELPYKSVQSLYNRNGKACAELMDGTTYRVIAADQTLRGQRLSDVYIQEGVDQNFIDSVIFPFLVAHDDKSEPSITYFD